jgi:hypothetical protein
VPALEFADKIVTFVGVVTALVARGLYVFQTKVVLHLFWAGRIVQLEAARVPKDSTIIVTEAVPLVPFNPVHDNVNVVRDVKLPVEALPDVACAPDQPPLAVQLVALSTDQLRVVAVLYAISVEAAEKVIIIGAHFAPSHVVPFIHEAVAVTFFNSTALL